MTFLTFNQLHLQMARSKTFTVLLHIACWLLFCSVVIAFVSVNQEGGRKALQFFHPYFIQFYFIFPVIFYCNRYILIPFFFAKKQYVFYFLSFAVFFMIVFWLRPFDDLMQMHMNENPPGPPPGRMIFDEHQPPPRGDRNRFDIMSIILLLLVWLFSSAMFVFRQWRSSEERALHAEADKANAELSFLKAQVNPHFLFNTLNNIYSLAVNKSEHTAASIMKLSNIMRYITDDAKENLVSLSHEIEFMSDYIDLQRMRLGKQTEVDFRVTGNAQQLQIAPLLLMSFVENAFKYGVSNHEASTISIELKTDAKTIYFETKNKLFDTKKPIERTGIGQTNALQRLQRLYPGKHAIEFNSADGFYTVQLTLQT